MAVVQNGSKVKNSKERSRQISSLTPPIGGPSVNLGEGPSLTPTEVGGWGVVRGFRFGLAGWVYLGIDLVRPALFGGSPCVESGFASLICGCSATLVTSTRGSLPDPQGHKGRTEEAPLTAAAVPHARGGQETQLQLSHWRTAFTPRTTKPLRKRWCGCTTTVAWDGHFDHTSHDNWVWQWDVHGVCNPCTSHGAKKN